VSPSLEGERPNPPALIPQLTAKAACHSRSAKARLAHVEVDQPPLKCVSTVQATIPAVLALPSHGPAGFSPF
jgi:hypothetical protein